MIMEVYMETGAIDIRKAIESFFSENLDVGDEGDIYNEFSLQHELGIHLREVLGKDYAVRFEKNINNIFGKECQTVKKEIDISIFSDDGRRKVAAIELKFPRNGQYPEQMYQFCKDIEFMEEAKRLGFGRCFTVVLADDPKFFMRTGRESDSSIYNMFRTLYSDSTSAESVPITNKIQKPTGNKDGNICVIKGCYRPEWKHLGKSDIRYYIIEVKECLLGKEAIEVKS